MNRLHLLGAASATLLAGTASAQAPTSDCAFDELRGPVASVTTERARYEDRDGQPTLGAFALRAEDAYDEACNHVSRTLYDHSVVRWVYWPDEDGRGQRLRTWTEDRPGAAPPPPPAPPPGGRSAVPERDRGTRIETVLSADASEVFEREVTNRVVTKDWVHTLDGRGRVVRSLMRNTDGDPDYRIERSFDGAETVTTYERLATGRRSSTSYRRERTVDEAADERGNWTRRSVYAWDDASGTWLPREVLMRTITYR